MDIVVKVVPAILLARDSKLKCERSQEEPFPVRPGGGMLFCASQIQSVFVLERTMSILSSSRDNVAKIPALGVARIVAGVLLCFVNLANRVGDQVCLVSKYMDQSQQTFVQESR